MKVKGFYEYIVRVWDEIDGKEQIEIAKGVVEASTYAKAMKKISAYYGDKDIEDILLSGLEENYVYEISSNYNFNQNLFALKVMPGTNTFLNDINKGV